MKCRILAPIVMLMLAVGLARAEYVAIILNLNAPTEAPGMGGDGGMTGGGMTGVPATNVGGAAGAVGVPGGMRGGPGMGGGMPMPGPMGGPMGGMGLRGGPMPGFPGMVNPDASDDAPNLIVAVVEVGGQTPAQFKKFAAAPDYVGLTHPWGGKTGKIFVKPKMHNYEAILLETEDGKPLPSVKARYQALYTEKTKTGKASTADYLDLAKWALGHGLLDEHTKAMDKVVESDKSNTSAIAYSKIKEALEKPLAREDLATKWKTKLGEGYQLVQSEKHHFAIMHNFTSDGVDLKSQMDRLEKSFKGYFYWFALKGIALPVPSERQLAVITTQGDSFKRLHEHMTASPVHTDSFFARREGVAIYASRRGDGPYKQLDTVLAPKWALNYNRTLLLTSALPKTTGIPNDVIKGLSDPKLAFPLANDTRILAVLQRALEEEWEATSISNQTSRQLAFATGLLPTKVVVPEWIQSGIGSFFEVPLQTPWGGPGGVSPYWLSRFRDAHRAKKYGANNLEAMLNIITDAGFRNKPTGGDTEEILRRRARAGSWALTYFLANQRLDGLQKYFKELKRMPRDVELDAKVLEGCFARAFDCVKADRTVDRVALRALADKWDSFLRGEHIEAEVVHKKIREFYSRINATPGGIRPGGGAVGGGGVGGGGIVNPGGGGIRPGGS